MASAGKILALLGFAATLAAAQAAPAPTAAATITGTVLAGAVPVPGVVITLLDPASGAKLLTSTDADGKFIVRLGHAAAFTLEADMPGFAPLTRSVSLPSSGGSPPPLQLHLTLAAAKATVASTAPEPSRPAVRSGRAGARGNASGASNSFQNADLNADVGAQALGVDESTGADAGAVAGMATDTATESVAVNGNFNNDNRALGQRDLQTQLQQLGLGPGGAFGDTTDASGNPTATLAGAGRGGLGGFGGRGGRGGGGGGGGFGGRGGFRINTLNNRFNQPHGNLSYTLSDSALNALPYSVTGVPSLSPPNSAQQRYTGTVTGPLIIPHLYNDNGRTSYTVSFTGNHSANLITDNALVPTAAERGGDFAGFTTTVNGQPVPVTIVNPSTGAAFNNNTIPMGMISSAATGLLAYYPLPNVPAAVGSDGRAYNYTVTQNSLTNTGQLSLRLNHTFTTPTGRGGNRGGGRGGRGGRGRSLAIAFTYQGGHGNTPGIFPQAEQTSSRTRGLNAQFTFNTPIAGWLDNFTLRYNRSRTLSTNLWANSQDIASQLGIQGVSQAPLDWGLPTITLNNFQGLSDSSPVFNRSQTWTVTDGVIRRLGRHSFRFGGDARFVNNAPQTDSNARGTFQFNGEYTGFDLADFLLGDARETTLRYGGGTFYFHQNSDDLYFQDNWQRRGNLTLNYGLRWEFVSPYTEQYNRLTNLTVAPGFASVTPVLAGQNGVPAGILYPERDALEPRLGFAWRSWDKMVVNAGYGVNLNTGGYANMATQLAYQEPFVTNATNIATPALPLSLTNGFPTPAPGAVVNTYSVDPNYRLGYVQSWLFDVQRQVGRNYVVNVVYNGTKGTDLDQLRAPNRTPTGLLFPNVVPFYYETSGGSSIFHSGSLLVSRRLSHGVSFRSTYTYSKSIDDASSIAGGGGASSGASGGVAQNDLDLDAERALSSFDMRHNFSTNFEWQLPYGLNHRWGDQPDWQSSLLGDWQWSGTLTLHSGQPFSPAIANSALQGLWGVNATLRPNLTGAPITLANPTYLQFFNPAAFAQQSSGYGDAGRDIIIGPGAINLNFSLAKTFRIGDFQSLDLRFDGTNALNHPNWQGVVTQINSPLFGQVAGIGAMRKISFVARYRF